jgi:hypothetical protein
MRMADSTGSDEAASWRVFISHTSELRDFPAGRSTAVGWTDPGRRLTASQQLSSMEIHQERPDVYRCRQNLACRSGWRTHGRPAIAPVLPPALRDLVEVGHE